MDYSDFGSKVAAFYLTSDTWPSRKYCIAWLVEAGDSYDAATRRLKEWIDQALLFPMQNDMYLGVRGLLLVRTPTAIGDKVRLAFDTLREATLRDPEVELHADLFTSVLARIATPAQSDLRSLELQSKLIFMVLMAEGFLGRGGRGVLGEGFTPTERVLQFQDLNDFLRQPSDGSLIPPDFLYRRTIGSGGYGVVYEVEAMGNPDRRYAMKRYTVFPLSEDDASVTETFVREATALTQLHHPNIVRCERAFHWAGTSYLLLEYVDGRSLASVVRSEVISLERIGEIGDTIARVLEYAHARDIVVIHGDIRSSNVLISSDGIVKVLDYGLSRLLDDRAAESSRARGPANRLPPEVRENPNLKTPSQDVYQWGLLMVELLTGREPVLGELPNLRSRWQELPTEMEAVIRRCLAPAAERYPTGRELWAGWQSAIRSFRLGVVGRRSGAGETAANAQNEPQGVIGYRMVLSPPFTETLSLAEIEEALHGASFRRREDDFPNVFPPFALNVLIQQHGLGYEERIRPSNDNRLHIRTMSVTSSGYVTWEVFREVAETRGDIFPFDALIRDFCLLIEFYLRLTSRLCALGPRQRREPSVAIECTAPQGTHLGFSGLGYIPPAGSPFLVQPMGKLQYGLSFPFADSLQPDVLAERAYRAINGFLNRFVYENRRSFAKASRPQLLDIFARFFHSVRPTGG